MEITASDGRFSLLKPALEDTIKVTCIGYKPYYFTLDLKNFTDTLLIALRPQSLILNQVNITGIYNYKSDSLRIRKEFGSVFNYKAPSLKDAFIKKSSESNRYNTVSNNTSQILSVNVLSLIGLIGKNKTSLSKLQKTLQKDEEVKYIEHLFSKQKVIALTALKGDSLQAFMETYRPSLIQLKKMSGYDLMIYIKKSYNEFIKTYRHENTSPFKK
jgi:hypothetical protein